MTGPRLLGWFLLTLIASPAMAQPPADLDACLDLSADVARRAGEKIKTEADCAKYYMKSLDLTSACGSREFDKAEQIANDIRATFGLN